MRWRTRWLALLACTVWAFTSYGVAAAEDEPVCPPGWRDTSVGSMEFCTHDDPKRVRSASAAWAAHEREERGWDHREWRRPEGNKFAYTTPQKFGAPTETELGLEAYFQSLCTPEKQTERETDPLSSPVPIGGCGLTD